MTYFNILIEQVEWDGYWSWAVVRVSTVSDTESVVASGRTKDGATAALAACEARDSIESQTAAQEVNEVYKCVRCRSEDAL